MKPEGPVSALPGFRRRVVIEPGPNRVSAELEDDYHRMAVVVHHDGVIATAIEPVMKRIPWSTCPGALAQVCQTFTGIPLAEFGRRGEKAVNCTHLHDLAVWAAAHAHDDHPTTYDVIVSDPDKDGEAHAQLLGNGVEALAWSHVKYGLTAPEHLAGTNLFQLNGWIAALSPQAQEEARLLRWGTMIAGGRSLSQEVMNDPHKFAGGRCHTFSEAHVDEAKRIGLTRDFPAEMAIPLEY